MNPSLSTPHVASLEDLFNWVEHTVQHAAQLVNEDMHTLKSRMLGKLAGFTMSTAFSGIGAPEHAMHGILANLASGQPLPLRVKNLHAIEVNQESRRELVCLPAPPQCLFDDINSFWNKIYDVDETCSLEQLTHIIRKGNAITTRGGWCSLHQAYCELEAATCNVGGTPCPDWSAAGSRAGECGLDRISTLAWVAMRYQLEENYFLNENVPVFQYELMLDVLADKYMQMSCVCKLEKSGRIGGVGGLLLDS